MRQIPDAVDTVVCVPDGGWCYHPKHVEQFPDKINSVTLHLNGCVLECECCVLFRLTSDFKWLTMLILLRQAFVCFVASQPGLWIA